MEAIINENTQNDNPGIFKLVCDGNQFHVIPSKVRSASGEMVAVVPILDHQITIPDATRTINATLELLCQEISTKAGTTVIFSDCPSNLMFRKITFCAENETARTVLKGILAKAQVNVWEQVKISYTVWYDANEKVFRLGIHTFMPIETKEP